MLGRAYAMTDRHEMACWKYKLALRSLYNHHHLRAYRLTIQLRLAVSEAKSNRFDSARIKMNEVINGRIEILGYSSEKTCAAIETFNDMLKQFGRADEASQMYAHHAMEYDRQQQRQWYKMEGFFDTCPPFGSITKQKHNTTTTTSATALERHFPSFEVSLVTTRAVHRHNAGHSAFEVWR